MKKFLCAALAASIFTVSASAKDLVHVSDWAYNDVSVFTSEGLMTSGFDSVSDYRGNITRGQFAELICSVLLKTGNMSDEWISSYFYSKYDDIGDNRYYRLAIDERIVLGEVEKSHIDENGEEITDLAHFYPDREISRQEAAVLLYRAAYRTSGVLFDTICNIDEPSLSFSDKDETADYAALPVTALTEAGLINGVGGGRFDPLGKMTIEQAITILYRFYRLIPSVPTPDGDGISAETETKIRDFENGYTETKLNDTLYIKKDGVSLAFDTDIYSNIYCVTASDGNVYAAAQTYRDSTDIFDVNAGKLIATAPYNTCKADGNYVYVKSARMGQSRFGLYSFDGKEIMPPEYSLAELDEFIKTGSIMRGGRRDADGWIFYADWEDGGHMYRVDTNGENKQKISDEDCYYIAYHDGWIYYHTRGNEGPLYCMKPDGTGAVQLSDGFSYDVQTFFSEYCDGTPITGDDSVNKPRIFMFDEVGPARQLLYEVTHENGGTQKRLVTDIPMLNTIVSRSMPGEKIWLYFRDDYEFVENNGEGSGPTKGLLYRTDGKTVECLNSEKAIENFDVLRSEDGETLIRVFGDFTVDSNNEGHYATDYIADEHLNYIADFDESKYDLRTRDTVNGEDEEFEGVVTSKDGVEDYVQKRKDMSDENYEVYYHSVYDSRRSSINVNEELYCVDRNGNKTVISDASLYRTMRWENTVYYIERESERLMSFNMDTGESRVISDDARSNLYAQFGRTLDGWPTEKQSFGMFGDRDGNVWKCDFANGDALSEIYPNNGSNRYGTPAQIVVNKTGKSLLKIDSDGNYCDIVTGVDARYAVIVMNGEKDSEDVNFSWSYAGVVSVNEVQVIPIYHLNDGWTDNGNENDSVTEVATSYRLK